MISRGALQLPGACRPLSSRAFSSSQRRLADYESTIDNLRHIDANTRVIYQGELRPVEKGAPDHASMCLGVANSSMQDLLAKRYVCLLLGRVCYGLVYSLC